MTSNDSNASFDEKVALIASILENAIPTGVIVQGLAEHQDDMEQTLDALLCRESSKADPSVKKSILHDTESPSPLDAPKRKRQRVLDTFLGRSPGHINITQNDVRVDEKEQVDMTFGNNAFDILLNESPSPSRGILTTIQKLDAKNVSQSVPCYLLHNIWDPDLANKLLMEQLEGAHNWGKLTVRINERVSYSSHNTRLFADRSQKRNPKEFTYAGSIVETHDFSDLMRQVATHISTVVNNVYSSYRPLAQRTGWEIQEEWIPSMAVSNWYPGPDASVGAHSDKLTMIGPMPVIASYTLGATRTFRLRRLVKAPAKPNIYDILLPHNSLLIMFPPCQEQFKHEVPKISAKLNGPCSTHIRHVHPDPSLNARIGLSRINLTFRMARPEYINATPTCDCGNMSILKPVLKAKESLGRYFYMCGGAADSVKDNGEKKPFTCRFFQWLDHPIPPEKSEDNKK